MISLVQWFFQQDDYENDYEIKEKKYKTISSRKTFKGETAVTERQTNIQTNRDRQTDHYGKLV